MKGKYLYPLILSLTDKERKQLFHHSSLSKDKRYAWLRQILLKSIKDSAHFEEIIESTLKSDLKNKNSNECDSIIRRFIHFASDTIEEQKILNYLGENSVSRHTLLVEIAQRQEQVALQEIYVKKLSDLLRNSNKQHLKSLCLDWQIKLYGQQQHDKSIPTIRTLLRDKLASIHTLHYEQVANFYLLFSNLYLDDNRLLQEPNPLLESLLQLETSVQADANAYYIAEYHISKARLAFFDAQFDELLIKAKNFIAEADVSTEAREKLCRRIYFLQLVNGFHQGKAVTVLLDYARRLIEFDLRYKFRDSLSFYYYQLLLIIDQKAEEFNKSRQHDSYFYSGNTAFFKIFIKGMEEWLLQGRISQALGQFNQITYSPNYYISLWSKLIEIHLHYSLGNDMLCKNLNDRVGSTLEKNKFRAYTHDASQHICLFYKKVLQQKKPPATPPAAFSPLHHLLLNTNKI